VHVVLLQLKQSCLMLIVHHPPATQHSQSQDMTCCAKCQAKTCAETSCDSQIAQRMLAVTVGVIVLSACILPGQ